jgi:hypothetical protein
MKREANPGKPTISSPLNERERQHFNVGFGMVDAILAISCETVDVPSLD